MLTAGIEICSRFGRVSTGVARLSSARVVRCWVKSRNERNPHPYLPASNVGNYKETASEVSWRKVGTSSHHGPYELGYTRATMASTEGSDTATWSKSQKRRLSSDCTLQLECMKSESLVIADQHAAVNTFPGLVHTARHAMGVESTRR